MNGLDHLLHCPTCGPFGFRRRRRDRDADARGHVMWAKQLARETRASRVGSVRLAVEVDVRGFAPTLIDAILGDTDATEAIRSRYGLGAVDFAEYVKRDLDRQVGEARAHIAEFDRGRLM